ncbi:MAG TPA: alpha/beta fold hydrolase [Terriglobia bacterium]|nr:alpha/beta fold hydrolase [Terriglobia bacterium]
MRLNPVLKVLLLVCWVIGFVLSSSHTTQAKKKKEPPTKSVHGHVVDARKKSITGAKVFIRNVNKKTTTVLVTDENGLFAIYGLDPKVDYEVHAEHGKFVSEKKSISSFLDRFDNVFNFELGSTTSSTTTAAGTAASGQAVQLSTADQVRLAGDWYSPGGGDAKLPAVLLVHGFGEDRRQWDAFVRERLLPSGFAALTLDLRGHGASKEKAGKALNADASWRSDLKQFPVDIEAAILWLKSRNDVDVNRIAIIGCDLGADLAFLASGKYEEMRSAIAISGDAGNAGALARPISDFQPHSILYIATQGDSQATNSARELEKRTGFPVRVQIYENSDAHGVKILQEIPEAASLMIDWLRKM